MSTPTDGIRRRSWRRNIGIAVIVLVIAGICAGIGIIYVAASTALEMEGNLIATLSAVRVVTNFVDENGRWPRSWQELERMKMRDDHPYTADWPASAPQLRERVAIDFQADPESIVAQDPMQFTAIKPIGPHYEYRDDGFVELLRKSLEKAIEAKPGADGKPTPQHPDKDARH